MFKIRATLAALLLAACGAASADGGSCVRGPVYSHNKVLHFVYTGAVAAAVTTTTESKAAGITAGLLVGAMREIQKESTPGGRCEWSSMAYDVAGTLTGAYLANWYIQPVKHGVYVGWRREF